MELSEVKKGAAVMLTWTGLFIALASILGASIWDLLCWSVGRRRMVTQDRYQFLAERQPFGYNPHKNGGLAFSQVREVQDVMDFLDRCCSPLPPLFYVMVPSGIVAAVLLAHSSATLLIIVAMVAMAGYIFWSDARTYDAVSKKAKYRHPAQHGVR